MDYLLTIRLFVRAVELGSFSKAALAFNLKASSVSRHISSLEADLGTALFRRSTRHLLLTDAGSAFHERATRIIADIEEARRSTIVSAAAPVGILKLRAPAEFGGLHVVPWLAEFMAATPGLSVDLTLGDQDMDSGMAQSDVSIFIGKLPDSRFYAQKFAHNQYVVCGAPDYIARAGSPKFPSALREHNCLIHAEHGIWHFGTNRSTVEVAAAVSGNFKSNRLAPIAAAAAAGAGFARLPTWLAGPQIRAGALEPVLRNYEVISADDAIHGVYPERRTASPKLRAFLDFFAAKIGTPPYWEP